MERYTPQALPRLVTDCTFNELTARVAYRLVQLDYRRNPDRYQLYPPTGMLLLGDDLRAGGFGYIRWALVSMAKYVAEGGSTAEWKVRYPEAVALRAKHKQRLLRGPRR